MLAFVSGAKLQGANYFSTQYDIFSQENQPLGKVYPHSSRNYIRCRPGQASGLIPDPVATTTYNFPDEAVLSSAQRAAAQPEAFHRDLSPGERRRSTARVAVCCMCGTVSCLRFSYHRSELWVSLRVSWQP